MPVNREDRPTGEPSLLDGATAAFASASLALVQQWFGFLLLGTLISYPAAFLVIYRGNHGRVG
jgi:hypothetical protein